MIPDATKEMSDPRNSLRGQEVFVTGGTGFIGGRLVEKLVLEAGAGVRVLVRDYARASRIARFPVEMIPGDLNDVAALRRAMRGCSVVFHCACASGGTEEDQRRVNVEGTREVADAVLAEKVDRLVYVSSLAVYGRTPPGQIDETASRRVWNNPYASTKREAEEMLLRDFGARKLPVVILQPSIVYGPHSGWSVYPIEWLQTGRIVLVDGGEGLCNCVYVDDVVEALLLSAVRAGVEGEAFLISGPDPVRWLDFWGAYERMLGIQSTLSISERRCRRRLLTERMTPVMMKRILNVARHPRMQAALFGSRLWRLPGGETFRGSLRAAMNPAERPIHWPDPMQLDQAVMRTRLNLSKAETLLGFRPRVVFESGMALTEAWARWSGLLPDQLNVWEVDASFRPGPAGLPEVAAGRGPIA